MSIIKRICCVIFSVGFSSASFAEECLSNNTATRIEETVFSNSSYKNIPVYDDSGEENLDFGYSFAQSGDFFIVKHFRPNFIFTYFVTKLDTGNLIEANFNSYGILEGEPRPESYRIFYDNGTDAVGVLCGKANAGPLTIDPIIRILPHLDGNPQKN